MNHQQFLRKASPRGFALVLSLLILVLVTVTVVSFFTLARSDLSMANAYSRSLDTKQLADSTVSLVMSQIREATTGFARSGSGQLNLNNRLAWASQPGMLRTWDSNGADYKHFKLYSDDSMIIESGHATEIFADMNQALSWLPYDSDGDGTADSVYDAIWVDLNAPVVRVDETLAYPVVIPPDDLDPTNGLRIDNPATPQQEGVAGFSITDPPGFLPGTVSALNNPAPMPVKWLYVLADGTVVTPDPTSSTPEQAVLGPKATAANPPVGRIAFWTDDETCKLNLNTASEGVFWDVPLGWSFYEYGSGGAFAPFGFSNSVPGDSEFQRTPGHPATTSLSVVFGGNEFGELPVTRPVTSSTTDQLRNYYDMVPFIEFGGTKGGTGPSSLESKITPDQERLYASIDELYFDPDRKSYAERSQLQGMEADVVTKSSFFLTTASRAPDTTIWNTPRISLWPQMADAATGRNFKDRLLAFCSTLNKFPYYFVRAQAYNPSDKPQNALTKSDFGSSHNPELDFPGTPSKTAGFDPAVPASYPQRNRQLFAYLQELIAAPVPGFGGSLGNKYPEDKDQILTSIFDYIRSGINTLNVTGLSPAYHPTPYRWTNTDKTNARADVNGSGSSIPIRIGGLSVPGGEAQGLGRFTTLGQLTFGFAMTDFKDETTLASTRGGDAHDPLTWWVPTPNGDNVPDDELSGKFSANALDLTEGQIETLQAEIHDPMNPKFTDSDYDEMRDEIPAPPAAITEEIMNKPLFAVYDGIGDPSTTEVRPYLIVSPLNLMPGQPYTSAYARYEIEGLDSLALSDSGGKVLNLGFPTKTKANRIMHGQSTGSSNYSASTVGFGYNSMLSGLGSGVKLEDNNGVLANHDPKDTAANPNLLRYPWVGDALAIDPRPQRWGSTGLSPAKWKKPTLDEAHPLVDGSEPAQRATQVFEMDMKRPTPSMKLLGGPITVRIYNALDDASFAEPIQTIEIDVPDMEMPVPTFPIAYVGSNGSTWWESNDAGVHSVESVKKFLGGDTENDAKDHPAWDPKKTWFYHRYVDRQKDTDAEEKVYTEAKPWDFEKRFVPVEGGGGKNTNWANQLVWKGDVLRSIAINPDSNAKGDLRLMAYRKEVPTKLDGDTEKLFTPYGDFNSPFARQIGFLRVESGNSRDNPTYDFANTASEEYPTILGKRAGTRAVATNKGGYERKNAASSKQGGGSLVKGRLSHISNAPVYTGPIDGTEMKDGSPGDWTAQFGNFAPGPWVPKGDEGFQAGSGNYANPYYTGAINYNIQESQFSFSPNRQVPSPVMFGSIPTGVFSQSPWQTLLFSGVPAAKSNHPGMGQSIPTDTPNGRPPYVTPPDHLFLDLFHMPVVEPYAISEPFSTAGKVNLNQAIMPFDYIRRDTALRGVLRGTQLMAVHNDGTGFTESGANSGYSLYFPGGFSIMGGTSQDFRNAFDYRYDLNEQATLDGWWKRFSDFGDLYRSASEVCSLFLVPQQNPFLNYGPAASVSDPSDYAAVEDWWDSFQMTPDNYRESPYNSIYPRLTTKSNIYRVHYVVQNLQGNSQNGDPSVWVESEGRVLGEVRGSTLIERYIDPNNKSLPDFAELNLDNPEAVLDNYYRFRVLENKKFTP